MDWNGLLSAVLGAVIGAVFGTLGSQYVTKHAIRETAETDRAIRREAEAEARIAALRSVGLELRLNAALAAQATGEKGGSTILLPFRRQALNATLSHLASLPTTIAEALQRADLLLARDNLMTERQNTWYAAPAERSWHPGRDLTAVLLSTAEEANPLFLATADALDAHLAVCPPTDPEPAATEERHGR